MDSTKKFSGREEIYAKYRPQYPEEYIGYLIRECDLNKNSLIADIGSGTGILSLQLLKHDLNVIAVEPNDDMRGIADQLLSAYPNSISKNGTAENTAIENKSIDLITVAQAFHWFDVNKFKTECQRILKPNQKVALVWNNKIPENDIEKELSQINYKYCPNYKGISGKVYDITENIFEHFFRDGLYEFAEFQNPQYYDLEGFIGRNLSSSYAPKKEDENYSSFCSEIINLFEKYQHDGKIAYPYITQSYLGLV